jgi:hypothetical protein
MLLLPFLIGAGVYFLSKPGEVREDELGVFLHGVEGTGTLSIL